MTHKSKTMSMNAKLTEKNIKALEAGGGALDEDLGMCTPGSVVAKAGTDIKEEFPSLEPLKELSKSSKTAQLISIYSFFIL